MFINCIIHWFYCIFSYSGCIMWKQRSSRVVDGSPQGGLPPGSLQWLWGESQDAPGHGGYSQTQQKWRNTQNQGQETHGLVQRKFRTGKHKNHCEDTLSLPLYSFFKFWRTLIIFVGPLIRLLLESSDVCLWFQSDTFSVTSMIANPFST